MNSTTPFFRMSRADYPGEGDGCVYYSCNEIEGAVTFINSSITMCGHVHSTNKGMPVICEYKGGIIPAERVIEAREELRRMNQTDADTPCKGCQFLKKRSWLRSSYLFNHITVGHYTPCNLRCNYCYRTAYTKEESNRLSVAPYNAAISIKNIIAQRLLAPTATAWLTGGEPTLFVDFEQIINVLLNNNVRTTIGTNCTKLNDLIKKGLNSNLIEVLCSIDAGTRSKYHEIKGKDLYDVVWNNVEQYASINRDAVIVKYIFMDGNATESEALAFINTCKSRNIGKISISRDIRKYQGVLSPELEEMPEYMYNTIVLMMHEAIINGIKVNFDVNWPVFTDNEIMKIKLLFHEKLTFHSIKKKT